MADLASTPHRIQLEQTRFKSAISESLAQNLGETMNYILDGYVIPPGSYYGYAGLEASIPVGWLLCDGRAVSRTTYANLFAAVSTIYGSGDFATTFNVPDLRGRFLRGTDVTTQGDAGRDPGEASRTPSGTGTASQPGSTQLDAIGSHSHRIPTQAGGSGASIQSSGDSPVYTQSTETTGGAETTVKNMYCLYIIKT